MLCFLIDMSFSQEKPFVPADFDVPGELENEHLRLRTLTVNDVVKDYDAVMSSREHLQGVFGPRSQWPSEDLSLEQDLIDLGWHQKEFQRRSSFAYTVVSLDESEVLGCVYIYPSSRKEYDSVIIMWVRKSAFQKGLDPVLFDSVKSWIDQEWPFSKVAYPGREITWDQWYNND